jgi:hypothetical protein
MKKLMVIAKVFLAIALSGEAFAAGPSVGANAPASRTIQHNITSGDVVETGWADELSQAFLMASIDTLNGTSTAFVIYSGSAFDPTSQVCMPDPLLGVFCRYTRITFDSVSANINPNDLRVTANAARLNTDLAMASNVVFSRCVFDDAAGTSYCTDVFPSGLISLELRKTNTDSVRSWGITESKSGPLTVKVTGTRVTFSANTNGSILGTAVQNKPGSLGKAHSTSIEILRTH